MGLPSLPGATGANPVQTTQPGVDNATPDTKASVSAWKQQVEHPTLDDLITALRDHGDEIAAWAAEAQANRLSETS